MNLALFYDTETTGLPLFNEPSDDPRQPHIVQLGAALVDMASREIVATVDVIVRPNGWTIPDEVAAIHGITTEKAMACGISEVVAIHMLAALWACAEERIAHNETFDARIVRIGLKRYAENEALPHADLWKEGAARCTANLATPIMKMAPTDRMRGAGRGGQFKKPKLSEAYEHFFGKPLDGAHNAMVDVRACMEVFFAIQDLQAQPAAA